MDRFLSIWKFQIVLGKYFWMFGFWCRHKKIWFRSETHSRGDVYSAVFDVSISQKYWRSFLRKVNKASLEMGSPMQMMLRTHPFDPKLAFSTLEKGEKNDPHHCCASLHNWILGLFLFWTRSASICLVFCSRRTNLGGKTWRSPYQPSRTKAMPKF